MQLRNADYRTLQCANVAANDALQRRNDMRSRHNGIGSCLRHGRVRSGSLHLHHKSVCRRHQWPAGDTNGAYWQVRLIMHADDCMNAFQRSAGYNLLSAFRFLLSGLEQKPDLSFQIRLLLFQLIGGTDQRRRMEVMPAGMTFAGMKRSIGQPGFLLNRQRINIGAQGNHRALLQSADLRNNACLQAIVNNSYSGLLQQSDNIFGRFEFFVRKLRVPVKMAADADHRFI
ncbi:hypothetical protein D3C74_344570 [compost metagenome]